MIPAQTTTVQVPVGMVAPATTVVAPTATVPVGMVAPGVTVPGMVPAPVYNVDDDVRKLHEAMKGVGTRESSLIEVLAYRPRDHIQRVATTYEVQHGPLKKALESETSGDFKDLLVGLVTPFGEYCADLCYFAMKGAGTNERRLIDVITQLYPYEMLQLVAAWNKKYFEKEGTLTQRIRKDCSGNFSRVLCACVNTVKTAGDMNMLDVHVEAIFRAGEKRFGTDEDTFIEILTAYSPEYLQQLSKHYRTKHGNELEKVIKKETSGWFCDALIALIQPRAAYVATRVRDSIKGLGTNDSALIRTFILSDKNTLRLASSLYSQFYNETLEHALRGDTSGNYEKLLLALAN